MKSITFTSFLSLFLFNLGNTSALTNQSFYHTTKNLRLVSTSLSKSSSPIMNSGTPVSASVVIGQPTTTVIDQSKVKNNNINNNNNNKQDYKQKKKKQHHQQTTKRYDHDAMLWELTIYNDTVNTRERVAHSLVQVITQLSEQEAFHTMQQSHTTGSSIVGTYHLEMAELYHEGLRKKGILSDITPVTITNSKQ